MGTGGEQRRETSEAGRERERRERKRKRERASSWRVSRPHALLRKWASEIKYKFSRSEASFQTSNSRSNQTQTRRVRARGSRASLVSRTDWGGSSSLIRSSHKHLRGRKKGYVKAKTGRKGRRGRREAIVGRSTSEERLLPGSTSRSFGRARLSSVETMSFSEVEGSERTGVTLGLLDFAS